MLLADKVGLGKTIEASCARDGDRLVVYELKHPFRAGTTHVPFEPLDFITRLAALGSL